MIDRVLRVRVFISRWVMMIDYGAHSVLGFSVFFLIFLLLFGSQMFTNCPNLFNIPLNSAMKCLAYYV